VLTSSVGLMGRVPWLLCHARGQQCFPTLESSSETEQTCIICYIKGLGARQLLGILSC
jgi:hypothetical protein